MLSYKFDQEAILRELGFEHSDQAIKEAIVKALYEQLDMRVGNHLLTSLTPEELKTLSDLSDESDEKAQAWLSQHFPDYKHICDEELEMLVAEVRGAGDAAVGLLHNKDNQ